MGSIIPVEIPKPHEDYNLTSGDIRQITEKIIKQLGEKDAKRVAEYLCLELSIGDFKE